MVTSSPLKLDIDRLLEKVERLTGTELSREVVEVTLEPSLNTIEFLRRRSFARRLIISADL